MQENSSKLYSARIHSPFDKITLMQKNDARYVTFIDGVIFLVGYNSPITFIDTCMSVKLQPSRITSKKSLTDVLLRFGLSVGGTMANMHQRLTAYLNSVSKQYATMNYLKDSIIFWESDDQPLFEAFCCVDKNMMYVANSKDRTVNRVLLNYDGIGIRGNSSVTQLYEDSWSGISSLCIIIIIIIIIFYLI